MAYKIKGINVYRDKLEKHITFQSGYVYLGYNFYDKKRYVIGIFIGLLTHIIGAPVVLPLYIGNKKPMIRNLYLIKIVSWIVQIISIPVIAIGGLLYLMYAFIAHFLSGDDMLTRIGGFLTMIFTLIGIYQSICWIYTYFTC